MQTGLRDEVDRQRFALVQLRAPSRVQDCTLCHLARNDPRSTPLERLVATQLEESIAPSGSCAAWSATPACCGSQTEDDVEFVVSALDAVLDVVHASRVTAIGVATGGFMALKLLCTVPDRFDAIAAYAAAADPAACADVAVSRQPDVMLVTGEADTVVPRAGGVNSRGVAFASAEESERIVAGTLGCAAASDATDGAWATDSEEFAVGLGRDRVPGTEASASCPRGTLTSITLRGERARHFLPVESSKELFRQRVLPALLTGDPAPAQEDRQGTALQTV